MKEHTVNGNVKSRGVLSLLVLAAGLCLALGAREARAQPFSESHVVIVIDRSGSMQSTRSNGATRFAEALNRARAYVRLTSRLPRSFAVWTFEGQSYIKEQSFANVSTTLATLNRLSVGTGSTPLAYAVCDAVDELLQYKPGVQAEKVIRLVSDGEENSTPPGSSCFGPDSTGAYPNLTPDSWQWKVRNMMKTGDPLRDDPGTFRLVFDVDVLYNYVSFSSSGRVVREEPPRQGNPAAYHPSSTSDYLSFLQGMAKDSGGTFTAINDSSRTPVYGDTNQDYCVNNTDYNAVLAYYGSRTPPAPTGVDVNHDGLIDYYDYSIIVNNYGQGEGCGAAR